MRNFNPPSSLNAHDSEQQDALDDEWSLQEIDLGILTPHANRTTEVDDPSVQAKPPPSVEDHQASAPRVPHTDHHDVPPGTPSTTDISTKIYFAFLKHPDCISATIKFNVAFPGRDLMAEVIFKARTSRLNHGDLKRIHVTHNPKADHHTLNRRDGHLDWYFYKSLTAKERKAMEITIKATYVWVELCRAIHQKHKMIFLNQQAFLHLYGGPENFSDSPAPAAGLKEGDTETGYLMLSCNIISIFLHLNTAEKNKGNLLKIIGGLEGKGCQYSQGSGATPETLRRIGIYEHLGQIAPKRRGSPARGTFSPVDNGRKPNSAGFLQAATPSIYDPPSSASRCHSAPPLSSVQSEISTPAAQHNHVFVAATSVASSSSSSYSSSSTVPRFSTVPQASVSGRPHPPPLEIPHNHTWQVPEDRHPSAASCHQGSPEADDDGNRCASPSKKSRMGATSQLQHEEGQQQKKKSFPAPSATPRAHAKAGGRGSSRGGASGAGGGAYSRASLNRRAASFSKPAHGGFDGATCSNQPLTRTLSDVTEHRGRSTQSANNHRRLSFGSAFSYTGKAAFHPGSTGDVGNMGVNENSENYADLKGPPPLQGNAELIWDSSPLLPHQYHQYHQQAHQHHHQHDQLGTPRCASEPTMTECGAEVRHSPALYGEAIRNLEQQHRRQLQHQHSMYSAAAGTPDYSQQMEQQNTAVLMEPTGGYCSSCPCPDCSNTQARSGSNMGANENFENYADLKGPPPLQAHSGSNMGANENSENYADLKGPPPLQARSGSSSSGSDDAHCQQHQYLQGSTPMPVYKCPHCPCTSCKPHLHRSRSVVISPVARWASRTHGSGVGAGLGNSNAGDSYGGTAPHTLVEEFTSRTSCPDAESTQATVTTSTSDGYGDCGGGGGYGGGAGMSAAEMPCNTTAGRADATATAANGHNPFEHLHHHEQQQQQRVQYSGGIFDCIRNIRDGNAAPANQFGSALFRTDTAKSAFSRRSNGTAADTATTAVSAAPQPPPLTQMAPFPDSIDSFEVLDHSWEEGQP